MSKDMKTEKPAESEKYSLRRFGKSIRDRLEAYTGLKPDEAKYRNVAKLGKARDAQIDEAVQNAALGNKPGK